MGDKNHTWINTRKLRMNGIMTAAVPLCHFCLGLRKILGQGWLTYGTRHSLLPHFLLFILPDQ
jgi:hypothetical protein